MERLFYSVYLIHLERYNHLICQPNLRPFGSIISYHGGGAVGGHVVGEGLSGVRGVFVGVGDGSSGGGVGVQGLLLIGLPQVGDGVGVFEGDPACAAYPSVLVYRLRHCLCRPRSRRHHWV